MSRNKKLTKKQEKTLVFIKKYIAKNEYPPTIREIAKGINLSSPATVHAHVKNLIEKEYIRRNPNNNRILELLVPNEFEQKITDTIDINLYSNIFPIKSINIPRYLKKDRDLFAFLIDDDNIILPNTQKNDIIILERISTYESSGIYLIKLNNNFILKNINDNDVNINNIIGRPISMYRKF